MMRNIFVLIIAILLFETVVSKKYLNMKVNSIGIIGGGIAGLALATSLKQLNSQVERVVLFESKSSLQTNLGGGLQLTGGAAILERIGLSSELRKKGNPIKKIVNTNTKGDLLLEIDVNENFNKYGKGVLVSSIDKDNVFAYSIMRDSLCSMLIQAAKRGTKDSIFSIKVNKKAKQIIETDRQGKLNIEFTDGTISEDFDMIIGADGISSVVRNFTEFGDRSVLCGGLNDANKYSGIRISYCVTPATKNQGSSLRAGNIQTFNQWSGDGCNALTASYGGEEGLQHMLAVVYRDSENAPYGLNPNWISNESNNLIIKKGIQERLRKAGFANIVEINELLEASAQKGGRFFDLGIKDSLVPLRKWSSKSGRVIIIGDSAHAMFIILIDLIINIIYGYIHVSFMISINTIIINFMINIKVPFLGSRGQSSNPRCILPSYFDKTAQRAITC